MSVAKKPNFLIFMVDQMQADVTRDDHPCALPRIKSFAREGVRFSRAFTPSPHCCPSRATFMSGCYPSRHGIWNNVNTVTAYRTEQQEGVRMFSESLAAAGYGMAFAGKWHAALATRPADRGWRELSAYPPPAVEPDRDRYSSLPPRGPRAWGTLSRPGWGDFTLVPEALDGPAARQEAAPWYQRSVAPALEELPRLAAGSRPWCLFVSTDMDPHNAAPRELLGLYDPATAELPASIRDDMTDKPNIYRRMRAQYWDQLGADEQRAAMVNYWANCSREDRHFGLLLDALERTGQADNTVVLFLSDHGEYNFAHGLQYMGVAAFRQAYHIPALVRWPKGIRNPGRTVDRFVTLADFAPTFLELAGCPAHGGITGRSLMPFLEARAPEDWPDAVFSQTNGNEIYFTQRGVTTDHYKFIYNAFDFDELYDLKADPDEMVNLIHPSRFERRAGDAPAPDNPWPHLPPALDAVRHDMMRRLWRFAYREHDTIFNGWPPVAIAAYGPGVMYAEKQEP